MVHGNVLRHIRRQRGFGTRAVADYTGISHQSILAFERDERDPTFNQIVKLSAAYGVSPYVLARNALPNLPESVPDFRKTHPEPAKLTPNAMGKIWRAERHAQFTFQLAAEVELPRLPKEAQFLPSQVNAKSAKNFRTHFDEWWSQRRKALNFSGGEFQKFSSAFRLFIELNNVIVNCNDAPQDEYRGFYLEKTSTELPFIYVNRSISSKKSQLFTLVHEVCHHLLKAEGISDPFVINNNIEKKCNNFAAEFLEPLENLEAIVSQQRPSIRRDVNYLVNSVADKSMLSRYATAIRLREGGFLNQPQLSEWISLNVGHKKTEREEDEERPPILADVSHAKRLTEVGYLPTFLAKKAIKKGIIDALDVERGLDISEATQERIFSLSERRVEAALS